MITIKLKHDYDADEYLPGNGTDGLCGNGLDRHFNLGHRPAVIWLELRDVPTKESVLFRLRGDHASGSYILSGARAHAVSKGVVWDRMYHISVLEQVT